MDGDPTLKPAQKTVAVKILAPVQPVPPAPMPALPHTPVQIDGMSVTPYVYGNGRLAKPRRRPGPAPRPHARTAGGRRAEVRRRAASPP